MSEDDLVPTWKNLGVPPESAMEQYQWLWHIELVLRHFIFARLRTSLGLKWKDALGDKLKRKAEGYLEASKSQEEFTLGHEPELIWFLSLNDLICLIKDNWQSHFCKLFPDDNGHEYIKGILEPVARIRNRWAHLRPVSPQESEAPLKAARDMLITYVSRWTRDYWHETGDEECKEICDALAASYRKRYSDCIPLLTEPVAGHHSGFRNQNSESDGDWCLYLGLNRTKDVYWVNPVPMGSGADNVTRDEVIQLAVKLRDRAVHIAVAHFPGIDVETHPWPFFSPHISLAKRDEDSNLCEALNAISSIVKKWSLERKKRQSASNATKETAKIDDDQARKQAQDYVYYNYPWNVIFWPTQETAQEFSYDSGE